MSLITASVGGDVEAQELSSWPAGGKLLEPLWRAIWQFPQKLRLLELPIGPGNSTQGGSPQVTSHTLTELVLRGVAKTEKTATKKKKKSLSGEMGK